MVVLIRRVAIPSGLWWYVIIMAMSEYPVVKDTTCKYQLDF
jgi:hypothetical protein